MVGTFGQLTWLLAEGAASDLCGWSEGGDHRCSEKLLSLPFMILTDGNKLKTKSQSIGDISGSLADQYSGPDAHWPSQSRASKTAKVAGSESKALH